MIEHENKPIWDLYSERKSLNPLDKSISTDVCIVGLGGSGLSAALHAAEAGYRVVAIDSKFLAAEAAGRNGGFLLNGLAKFYHETKQMLGKEKNKEVYSSTLKEIQWIKQRVPSCVRETGVLRRAESAEEVEDCLAHLNCLLEDGFSAEFYHGEQGTGIIISSDCVFDPLLRSIGLAELCIKNGVKLFSKTEATSFSSHKVETKHGTIEADLVIVAVDGKLHKMFPCFGNRIRPVRLQMCSTKPSDKRLKLPVYSNYGYDYWQQLPDGRVIIGGGRHVEEENEYTETMGVTDGIQTYLEKKLKDIGIEDEIELKWCGAVGYTKDCLPIKEEVAQGVWAVGGYNGTGNLIGPLLAKQVVDLHKTKVF